MKQRKFTVSLGAFLLVCLLGVGYAAASAEYGSKEDPVVTLSYINQVLQPAVMKEVDAVFAEKLKSYSSELDTKMQDFSKTMDERMKQLQGEITSNAANDAFVKKVAAEVKALGTAQAQKTWEVVTVAKGKTLKGKVGTELLLRIGEGTCYATASPGLINLSTGTELKNGSVVTKNNLYLVTVDDRGFKATTNATLLVKGDYTIG